MKKKVIIIGSIILVIVVGLILCWLLTKKPMVNKSFGTYVGNIYYYGKDEKQNGESDRVVASTVRQLVDYVDNDVTFSQLANATANTSWSATTVEELNTFIAPSVKTEVKQKDGTTNRMRRKAVCDLFFVPCSLWIKK